MDGDEDFVIGVVINMDWCGLFCLCLLGINIFYEMKLFIW